jgi:putative hydrolase of the HAD superfamily
VVIVAGGSRVVLWDFDGTLGYRPGMWSQAVVDAMHAADLGIPCTRDDVRPYLREGFPWHNAHIPHPHITSPEIWWDGIEQILARACLGLGCTPAQARSVAHHARRIYVGPAGWFAYDDVAPALVALREAGWKHVIVSNHVPELPAIVDHLGLAPYIMAVFTSACTGYEKPHPEAYRHVLAWLNHPSVIWMVGDNPVADVLGAEALGIPAVLVRSDDARASRHCADLAALVDLLTAQ